MVRSSSSYAPPGEMMARKNLLANLTGTELPAGNSMTTPPVMRLGALFPTSGSARGAVSRSIEQIRSHSVMELAPDLIDASFIEDRLADPTRTRRG